MLFLGNGDGRVHSHTHPLLRPEDTKQQPVYTMDFSISDEETIWLESISSQVSDDRLTPLEQLFHDLAKPQSQIEEIAFEFMAKLKFGLLGLDFDNFMNRITNIGR